VKVRIGLGLGARSAVDDSDSFSKVVDESERLRFDSLWVSERLAGPGLDPTVAMSVAAARTERLKFGPAVMVLPGRNPVVLAKTMASLDVVSEGRLLPAFGLGAPQLAEHGAFGVKREDRARIFDEALGLMRRLWTEPTVTHHGEHFDLDEVAVLPKPYQDPLEVWLGGLAPSELRRVGRLADGWIPSFVTVDDVEQGIATVNEVAASHDRRIDPEHFGVLIPYSETPIDDLVKKFLAARRPEIEPDEIVAPGLDELAKMIGRYTDVGASKFVVVPFGPITDVTSQLERLAAVVRPLEN
jgi:probable F420-dependent oxidoreductase